MFFFLFWCCVFDDFLCFIVCECDFVCVLLCDEEFALIRVRGV